MEMNTWVCKQPGLFESKIANVPKQLNGQTVLQIKRVGICGTDLHAYEGTQPFFSYPRILGHELAAVIIETDHADFSTGENVTIIPYFNCGKCIACRNEKPNCCEQLNVLGVHIDGALSEYISVPSNSLVKSKGLSFDQLALVEPLAIGAHGVKRANIQPGEFVLIVGSGPIGLGVIEFAKIAGAKVIVMDVQESRLQFCTEKFKIEFTINPSKEEVVKKLNEITNGEMPTVVIDATGNLQAINQSFQFLAHGGSYVLVGLQKGDIVFSHPEFHKREATVMSSRNATRQDFKFVIQSMLSRAINPLNYITHRVTFDQVKESFPGLMLPENEVIKAMVEFA